MAEEQRSSAPRPESTIVQSFSADLDSMFGLSGDVGHLEQTVEEKRTNVSSTQQQLQELEAKLRETEERLAKVSRGNSPARPAPQTQANVGAQRTHPSSTDKLQTFAGATEGRTSPLAQKPTYPADRPPTAADTRPQNVRENTQTMMAGMPGAMPQTPREYGGSSEYVMVDRNGARDGRGYGQSVG